MGSNGKGPQPRQAQGSLRAFERPAFLSLWVAYSASAVRELYILPRMGLCTIICIIQSNICTCCGFDAQKQSQGFFTESRSSLIGQRPNDLPRLSTVPEKFYSSFVLIICGLQLLNHRRQAVPAEAV
jgi:hypothetical protein